MLFLIFIFIFLFLIFQYIIVNKVHLDLKSFFKAGFSKKDDKFGLYTFVGQQGEGKTYSAVRMAINLKQSDGYTIVTNMESFNVYDDTIYEKDILKIIDLVIQSTDNNFDNRCKYIVLFDEIFTVLMRNAKNLSYLIPITNFLAQLRKRKIIFITTAQIWNEIPIEFRRLCRFVVSCHMFNIPIFNRAITINRIGDGYNTRWDDEQQDFIAPVIQTNIAKGNQLIIDSYDTFETVQTMLIISSGKAGSSKVA